MHIEELDFAYPERLVAIEREPSKSRIMLVRGSEPNELRDRGALFDEFKSGDCLVINETRVLKRRVFSNEGLEILFLRPLDPEGLSWSVLCPSSRWKDGAQQVLPDGTDIALIERGRTQVVRANRPLNGRYFEEFGEMPLPPYIQKARKERHQRAADTVAYQTAWARNDGSLAAPTASLHFTVADLAMLERRGVSVRKLVLHVGLGTFLPVSVADLDQHVMHAEWTEIPTAAWRSIQETRQKGGRVWALGTTVARALESCALGLLRETPSGYFGETDLFIRPGFEWQMVDALLTNFHQPRSTLLALVASFAGLDTVKACYRWAIEREFRLFSYGDLSVWLPLK